MFSSAMSRGKLNEKLVMRSVVTCPLHRPPDPCKVACNFVLQPLIKLNYGLHAGDIVCLTYGANYPVG
jgi:hypothetical protein